MSELVNRARQMVKVSLLVITGIMDLVVMGIFLTFICFAIIYGLFMAVLIPTAFQSGVTLMDFVTVTFMGVGIALLFWAANSLRIELSTFVFEESVFGSPLRRIR